MHKFKLPLVLAFALTLTIIGCRSNPVYNIDSAPVTISGKHNNVDVEKSIIRAGAVLGWKMKKVGKGHLVATLHLRSHVAVVDITFNDKTYSIKYKDSQNLNYDGTNIHSNYNGWIQNLDRAIQTQFQTY
jgi:hypothetical protein